MTPRTRRSGCVRGVAGCVEIKFLDVTPARWRASDSLVDFHTQEGLPRDDDENLQTRCVSFRTLPDVPEPPRPPKVRASRFRGAADLANLIAPYGTEKDSLGAMGAAVRPPHENTSPSRLIGYRRTTTAPPSRGIGWSAPRRSARIIGRRSPRRTGRKCALLNTTSAILRTCLPRIIACIGTVLSATTRWVYQTLASRRRST